MVIKFIRSGSQKTLLTASLQTVYDCGSKLYIDPFDLFKHKVHIQNNSPSISEVLCYHSAISNYSNIPGRKICSVDLSGLKEQLEVSPKKSRKIHKGLNFAFVSSAGPPAETDVITQKYECPLLQYPRIDKLNS